MKKSTLFIFCVSALVCLGNPLGELLRQASETHPALVAERAVVEQTLRRHEELAEYLDPSLYGAVGGATRIRDVPGAPLGYDTVDSANALEAQGGIRIPVEAGAVVSVGGVFRRWFEPDAPYDSLYQHCLGVNLQVPLWQDRGFALYGHRRAAALASCSGAIHRLQQVEQQVRRQVEAAYIRFCAAEADCLVWGDATERFRRLYQEASQLASLKAIPEYQVQTALRELQGGLADGEAARQARENAALALGQALGLRESREVKTCTSEELLQAALSLPVQEESGEIPAALERRGSYLAIQDDQRVAEAEAALEEEYRKDQVTLQAGVTWQGDSSGGPMGSYREVTDHHWGGEVLLVWSRPLDYTGPEAAVARMVARRQELSARLEVQAVEIAGEIRGAQLRVSGARRRLSLVCEGVQAARKTLEAEQERFRLGESTSAIVLDAQKELNNILLRQNATAAELLLAYAELQYALGYPREAPLL